MHLDQLNKIVVTHSSHFYFIAILSSTMVMVVVIFIAIILIAYKRKTFQHPHTSVNLNTFSHIVHTPLPSIPPQPREDRISHLYDIPTDITA